ncbi:hypothetical protein [Merismopedia glauca]|uniref:Uncharacterized protein n=1 Tax=Merismopedia glauca CCAP 1448/3 TaxID=1296344 RepID=A0A2T1C1S1_9CYAN|nr:hypothetical protein [Merismopedia glauca]PSB02211.1 hypothetical protein C7B64_14375 [Merismopedia glauca CCAP 1448/3]
MSTINIADLQVSGSDLFADSESYLNELDDSSFAASQIQGGFTPVPVATAIILFSAATRIAKEIMTPDCPPPPPFCE